MAYVKATAILPEKLISEIQKYVQGKTIYIPKPETSHQKWGACVLETELFEFPGNHSGYTMHHKEFSERLRHV